MADVFPDSPVPASLVLAVDAGVSVQVTRSGRHVLSAAARPVVSITLNYNRGTGAADGRELGGVWAFLQAHALQEFDMLLPAGHGPEWYGCTLASAAAVGADALAITGLPALTVVRRAGDLLQIGSDYTLHALAADLVSDASGNATATLCWPLARAKTAGDDVAISLLRARVRLSDAARKLTLQPGRLHQLDAVQVVETFTYSQRPPVSVVFINSALLYVGNALLIASES
jgi:hypothetical protein